MKVERTYLVRVVQVYEGSPGSDWDAEEVALYGIDGANYDQYICDNWKLVSDKTEFIDNDELTVRELA